MMERREGKIEIALRLDLNRNQIFNFQIEWISDDDRSMLMVENQFIPFLFFCRCKLALRNCWDFEILIDFFSCFYSSYNNNKYHKNLHKMPSDMEEHKRLHENPSIKEHISCDFVVLVMIS